MTMFGLFQKAPTPTIRRLGGEDAETCADVHAASFTYAWPISDMESLLTSPTIFADGAVGRGGELLGVILSRLAADEAEVLTIAVLPKRRGQGIARLMMTANMEKLRIAGAKSWFLEVEAQNASALALYHRFGFEKVGERKSYYKKADGDSALAYILRRNLA